MNSIIVAHPGAREHYALATAAHKAGVLDRLVVASRFEAVVQRIVAGGL
jgi:hypothetical protein